jgi:predicted GIY-YIG superfamily endonuclease
MAGYLRSRSDTGKSCKTCGISISPRMFYCRSCWWQLIALLRSKIEMVASEADEIYVGRTFRPDRRREQHHECSGRDQLTPLHWSKDFEEIVAVEEALIKKLDWHPKLSNKIIQSWGGERPDKRNCIYVSWRAAAVAVTG